jgi:hypothetical protein
MFFCVFILRHNLVNTKHFVYNINVRKSATEHKEKLEKPRFFGHFPILDIFKKCKKTSKWTEKNEHQHFFSCFSNNESMHGMVFF